MAARPRPAAADRRPAAELGVLRAAHRARADPHHGRPVRRVTSRRGEWLERVGLDDKGDTRVENLSGGQAQRLSIACALVQMAIFLGLGVAAFGPRLTGAWPASTPLLVMGTLCLMSIGLLAGSVTKTTEGAVNMANFIVLPTSFLSRSFFLLDAAPGWLQAVAHLLPLWWLNEGMLDVMVRGEPAPAVRLPMAVLAAVAAVVTAVAAKLFRWETT